MRRIDWVQLVGTVLIVLAAAAYWGHAALACRNGRLLRDWWNRPVCVR